jgi:hypothetical protein
MPAALQQSTRAGYFSSWRLVLTWGLAHGGWTSCYLRVWTHSKVSRRSFSWWGVRLEQSATSGRQSRIAAGDSVILSHSELREISVVWLGQWGRYAVNLPASFFDRSPSRQGPSGAHAHSATQRLHHCSGDCGVSARGEVSNVQICDCKFGHDAAWNPIYQGTMALGVYKRKQAQVRKGLYPRLRRAVTSRLEVYFEELGLEVSNEDTKDCSPGARCRACPPLFPSTVAGGTSSKPVSRQHVTKAVFDSLKMLDVDTKHFSGISMHRGGISAGLAALVPEPIPFLQSGHGSNCAARTYMVPRDPGASRLMDFNGQGQQTRWHMLFGDSVLGTQFWEHQHVQLQQPRPRPSDGMGT